MKTKKVKKKKLNFKKLLILILFLYLICYSLYYLFSRPISNIIITGNNFVSDNEIIEAAGLKNYPPAFTINKNKIKKKLLKINLIENVTISRNLKFEIKIRVTELKIDFLNLSNNKLILGNGTYIDYTNTYEGVPTLINYTPEDILKKFAIKLGKIDQSIISSISEIEYSPSKNDNGDVIDNTRFLLKMNDGNFVYTNISNCETLSYYQSIFASLNNKKGILNLDSGTEDRFVFTEFGSA